MPGARDDSHQPDLADDPPRRRQHHRGSAEPEERRDGASQPQRPRRRDARRSGRMPPHSERGQGEVGLKKVTKPADQHGTYSFYFSDLDDNWWEILTNPAGVYGWMFSEARTLAAWGAGKGDAVNPREYRQRGIEITP